MKLKLALFAKEKEKERSRIAQEAERAKQEAERKANEQERALDVELAKFEVKAWDEALSDRGDRSRPLGRPIVPSSVQICKTLKNAEKRSEQNIGRAVARNEQRSLEDNKTMTMANHLATSKGYNDVRKFNGMISQYKQPTNDSRQSRKIAEPEYEEDRRNVTPPVTHWHAPAGQSTSIPILTSQDYPPPRPVIPNFDEDPLTLSALTYLKYHKFFEVLDIFARNGINKQIYCYEVHQMNFGVILGVRNSNFRQDFRR